MAAKKKPQVEECPITLKNLKVNEQMSDETNCFSATIYFRGKRTGLVSNRGHGGENEVEWLNESLGQQVIDWLDSQQMEYPPCEWSPEPLVLNFWNDKLAKVCDDAIVEILDRRYWKQHLRNKTVFTLKGDAPDRCWTLKQKFSPEVKQVLREKYGNKIAEIFNETRV